MYYAMDQELLAAAGGRCYMCTQRIIGTKLLIMTSYF